MPIATDDQVKALDASLAESEARPLLERLADPRAHRPAKLREEARARISDLERTLALRDAATESLCIALHGKVVPGKSIYDLIFDADRLARSIEAANAVACRLMIEAARDQSSVVAVGKALDQVRVALRDGHSVEQNLAGTPYIEVMGG